MRSLTIWRTLLGVEKTIVEDVDLDLVSGILVASVRPTASMRNRCGSCRKRSPRFDAGAGRRRWRSLDAGSIQVQLEAHAPRVTCSTHGVIVAAVPWARHQSGHTLFFDDQVAWLATKTSKTANTVLMRIAWRTVGAIITRVWDDSQRVHDQFADLTRIGIDEISYKRGHKYLTVVVDHDSGRLVWAAPGRDKATLATFFDALVAGERNPQVLAGLARGTLRSKIPALVEALTGRFKEHHAFMARLHLDQIDAQTRIIDALTGRMKSSHILPGNKYLKSALGVAALAASRSKNTYLAVKYRRIAARRGPMTAIVALEHSTLNAAWNMLATGECYNDPSADHFTRLDPIKSREAIKKLTSLGYTVTITPATAA